MENSLIVTAQKSQCLLDDVRNFLTESTNEEMQALAADIPLKAIPEDKPLTIVFAGQYSAGKSSILKILTGINLATGEGIVTEKTTEINWNGLTVIDTPGIKTGVRPDHDAVTYKAIAQADLLVYVITESLFTPEISKDFRHLAFGCDKRNEMMLVVNKMNNSGNTEEIRNSKTNSILPDLAPATPDEFFTTFVSAESWFDAQETENERRREKKLLEANITDLENKLITFSQQRNLHAKFTTSLYSLDHQLDLALGVKPLVDKDANAVREFLRRQKENIVRAKRNIESQAELQIDEFVCFIRQRGSDLANCLEECKCENDFSDKQKEIEKDIKARSEQMTESIEKIIQNELEKLKEATEQLFNSDFSKNLQKNLAVRYEQYDPLIPQDKNDIISKTGKSSEEFGRWLNSCCNGKSVGGLGGFSGSSAHDVILKFGKLLGHKFKPWEAVKYVKILSNIAKGIAVVGIAVSLFMEAKETYDENKMKKNLQANRDKIRNAYIAAAAKMQTECKASISTFFEENLEPALQDINQKIEQLDTMEENDSSSHKKLLEFRKQTQELLAGIHNSEVLGC